MGLSVSVLAADVALMWPRLPHARAARRPALPVLALLVLHLAMMAAMSGMWCPGWLIFAACGAIFAAGVVFWLPVLGAEPRLGPAARTLYLFLAGPALDLPALVLIAQGGSVAGIAMVVTMLPIPLAGVASFYLWMRAEELSA
jgi:hypothetical protein